MRRAGGVVSILWVGVLGWDGARIRLIWLAIWLLRPSCRSSYQGRSRSRVPERRESAWWFLVWSGAWKPGRARRRFVWTGGLRIACRCSALLGAGLL